jgi:glycosyltransferase XagB
MAASSFAELPDDVVALQARLTFYNRNRSLMTKMFTIEYDIWFHHFLPGLSRLKLPLPLAGTSTHIRTRDIHDIGGWDAYNVTEDCDLGMRFYRMDLKTLLLDSDTFEEAPIYLNMWIKQRTRWLKGYMQTLFVHTGRLFTDISELGFLKFLGLWLVIGGQILSAFLHPIAIGCFIYQIAVSDFLLKELFVSAFKPMMIFLLIAGILIPPMQAEMIYRRMKKSKILWHTAFFHPIYWGFAAYSSYRAVLQLIYAPSYWEKTTHGLDLDDGIQQDIDIIHDIKTDE